MKEQALLELCRKDEKLKANREDRGVPGQKHVQRKGHSHESQWHDQGLRILNMAVWEGEARKRLGT